MIARAPRIFALDPSGRGAGVAIGAAREKPLLFTVRFATDELDRGTEIFCRASSWMQKQLTTPPDGLAIEQALVVHNPMIVCGLYAIFVGLPKSHGVKVMPVTISTWRKYFGGRSAKASAEPFGGHPPPGRARALGEGEITYYVPLRFVTLEGGKAHAKWIEAHRRSDAIRRFLRNRPFQNSMTLLAHVVHGQSVTASCWGCGHAPHVRHLQHPGRRPGDFR